MKHHISLRNITALLLAMVMLFGLVGCGQDEEPNPIIDKDGAVEQPLNLDQLRAEVAAEYDYTEFLGAYLGHTKLEEFGVGPTDNATYANYDIFDDIDEAHRIDTTDGAEEGQLFCVFPMQPQFGMVVSVVDYETDEVISEPYRSETGEPILVRCNNTDSLNTRVTFTNGDYESDVWLLTYVSNGEERFLTPNGGTTYDFTIYPSIPMGLPYREPAGSWQTVVKQTAGDVENVRMYIYMDATEGFAEFTYVDIDTGTPLAMYSGMWSMVDDKYLTLDLTCDSNDSGLAAYGEVISGQYAYTVGDDYGLTISVTDKNCTPFNSSHISAPITFYPYREFIYQNEYSEQITTTVQNYYETTFNYRPSCCDIEREEGDNVLVHLYDDMGDHTATSGWYLINPITLQGSDYLTDEPIDFSDFANGVG